MRLARWRGKRSLERSGDGRWMIEAEVAVWVPERVWKTRARGVRGRSSMSLLL